MVLKLGGALVNRCGGEWWRIVALVLALAGWSGSGLRAAGPVALGELQWSSPQLETDDIRGAVIANGVVHVVGNESGVGQRELFTPGT
ncbi:MAG: hypothetical protein R3C01_18425, partial [Planctomycetaceae bacterium]